MESATKCHPACFRTWQRSWQIPCGILRHEILIAPSSSAHSVSDTRIDDYRVTRGRDFRPGAWREDSMPDDHREGNETAPPVTSQPIPGPQEPQTGSREPATKSAPRRRRFVTGALKVLVAVVVVWLLSAYVILPALWRHYEHHPACRWAPKTTRTAAGIPGDPLNVGLIGTEEEVVQTMIGLGWDPADPITAESSFLIAYSVLLDRPYADAPVSDLFVFGRKQDLAFEMPVGGSASQRHHVRFWNSKELGRGGVPLWIGAVTFDRSVGLSYTTGQITHHIGPDIDTERDELFADLRKGGWLTELCQVRGRSDHPGMERRRRPVPHGRGTLDRRPRFGGGAWPDT